MKLSVTLCILRGETIHLVLIKKQAIMKGLPQLQNSNSIGLNLYYRSRMNDREVMGCRLNISNRLDIEVDIIFSMK